LVCRRRGDARRLRGGLGHWSSVGAWESRRPISTVTDVWIEESRRWRLGLASNNGGGGARRSPI
jgi:hypothetical protein